jgi:hypothetical protein
MGQRTRTTIPDRGQNYPLPQCSEVLLGMETTGPGVRMRRVEGKLIENPGTVQADRISESDCWLMGDRRGKLARQRGV